MAGATPEAGQTSAKRFQEAWDAFIEEESRSKDWTVATHRKYNAVRNRLKDFKTTLSFDDMEEKTLNKWVEFLQKQPMPDGTVGMKNSTVYKYIQFLRVFLNWATRKGYNTKLDYQSFRPNLKQAHNQPIYISPYTITQWTGHSSLAAMKPYMAIADKEKKNAMKKFDEI